LYLRGQHLAKREGKVQNLGVDHNRRLCIQLYFTKFWKLLWAGKIIMFPKFLNLICIFERQLKGQVINVCQRYKPTKHDHFLIYLLTKSVMQFLHEWYKIWWSVESNTTPKEWKIIGIGWNKCRTTEMWRTSSHRKTDRTLQPGLDTIKSPYRLERWQHYTFTKKGNLTDCNSWGSITLLSVPGKVMASILLHRIQDAVDEKLRREQAGFRKGRSCQEQIFTLRQIIEKVISGPDSILINFIDFKKAFDSVHRPSVWKILRSYGFPEKLINIIKAFYMDSSCAVRAEGQLSDWFQIATGVR